MLGIWVAIVLLAAVLVPGASYAQEKCDKTWNWDPPSVGTKPIKYRVKLYVDGSRLGDIETTDTNSYILAELEPSVCYQIEVSGVDEAGIEGPYSEMSDCYYCPESDPDVVSDNGPNKPGTPDFSPKGN